MHFKHIVSTVACYSIITFGYIISEQNTQKDVTEREEEFDQVDDESLNEDHTFVTLIDVVFPDGSKRTCTGSVIHDNGVITAAHCFVLDNDDTIQPELTASFVVIGTKRMFEAGYEQYLPIERIITHPRYHNWTADLALVFTFAGMISDKPGKIIKLAGQKLTDPVDSNVTVFSWGHGQSEKEDEVHDTWHTESYYYTKGITYHGSSSIEDKDCETNVHSNEERPMVTQPPNLYSRQNHKHNINKYDDKALYKYPSFHQNMQRSKIFKSNPMKRRGLPVSSNKPLSRYLTSEEASESEETPKKIRRKSTKKSIYKNWRRAMGTQQNKLTVNVFGLMNSASCKKIIEGASLPYYEFINGEVACYASEEHYITDDDAGAPVVRHGQLVAVTVRGAKYNGDYVGIGLKMSCYCSWIAANLPDGANMSCCNNCCDISHTKDTKKNPVRQRKAKYLWQ